MVEAIDFDGRRDLNFLNDWFNSKEKYFNWHDISYA